MWYYTYTLGICLGVLRKITNSCVSVSSLRTAIWTRDASVPFIHDFSSRFSDVETKKENHATAINWLRWNVTWHSNGLSSERVRIPTGRRGTDPHVVMDGSRGSWKYNTYVDGCLHNSIIIMQSHALVYEYRQSPVLPRMQLCVREFVRCVLDGVPVWHNIGVQTFSVIIFLVINTCLVIRGV